MLYTLPEIKDRLCQSVNEVYSTFSEFFGEQYVDLQNLPSDDSLKTVVERYLLPEDEDHPPQYDVREAEWPTIKGGFTKMPTIMVWWPSVTVSNEFDESVVIYDLYAKIPITYYGGIPYSSDGFRLNRSTYTQEQFFSHYMHSHCPRLSPCSLGQFVKPCLGNGPIRQTISSLREDCDASLWLLFCQELALYVTVESISGGPYICLNEIGRYDRNHPLRSDFYTPSKSYVSNKKSSLVRCLGENALGDFVKLYLTQGHLKFSYSNGGFSIGMSYYDFMLDISNAFIDFYNGSSSITPETSDQLLNSSVLVSCYVNQGKFYSIRSVQTLTDGIGTHICTFKGKEKTISVIDMQDSIMSQVHILNSDLAMHILQVILQHLNYWYNNEHAITRISNTATATIAEDVRFL